MVNKDERSLERLYLRNIGGKGNMLMSWILRFCIVVLFLEVGSSGATSVLPPSRQEQTLEGAVERFGHAPWIFLGSVQSIEIVTDPFTPASVFPRWQAQHTRFRVIQGVKGPFHEGDEVELKECAPRPIPSHSFCGSLYSRAPDSKTGAIFLVIAGPGNPNVYEYQTSIRLPATRIPVLLKPDTVAGQSPSGEIIEDDFPGMPWSESGWLVDLAGFVLEQEEKANPGKKKSDTGEVPDGRKGKASGVADQKEPQGRNPSRSVDLNQFKKKLQ
jgi:hypothetical protein